MIIRGHIMTGGKLPESRKQDNVELVSMAELLTLPPGDVLTRLGATEQGLTEDEAALRLEFYGANEVAARKRRATAVEFLLQFRSPLILLLIFAGAVSLYFGEVIDSAIIFTIIIASASLDFYQQSKAHQAAELLRSKLVSTCTAIRDGGKKEIRFTEVVPGDVLYFSAGDMIPADSRILTAKDFFLNQSALTGESFPVEKGATPLAEAGTSLTDWTNIAFTGSSVVSGTATAVVGRTGSSTEYGKIAKSLAARGEETEMERGLRRFGYLIMQVTFVLVIFVFFVNALFRRGVLESLLFSVALAVGLTPELLPMIISVNLSKGALAMSRHGVLVKRLSSIQNFGSMDILCTDKTGTLTENKITLVLHVDIDGRDDDRVLEYSYLNSYYQTGLRSPLDEAILAFRNVPTADYQKVDEIPFDFVRRRVSIVVSKGEGRLLLTKGAPEEVLSVCAHADVTDGAADLTESVKERIITRYRGLSAQGFRVLGIDVSEKAIDLARENAANALSKEAEFKVTDFRDLHGLFDAVLVSNLYHLLDPQGRSDLAKHAVRLLTPGGKLFLNAISVRDKEHYGVGTPVPGEENSWVDGKYLHLSTEEELRRDFSALKVSELYEHEYEEPHPGARTHNHLAWILVADKVV
jgi:Mg2+-importing ATPase